ncbi:MAG: C-terminal helicase domain-containing protein [Thermoleophilia bacterium]
MSFRPDTEALLATLKDFQRRTAEYAYRRMYEDSPPQRRFLVADEVGLGKTLVARGVIARVVDRLLDDGVERIDVIYVCSNQDIARQNIQRLGVGAAGERAMASRITMLPLQLKHLNSQRLNFVSFTPATSFELASSGGMAAERALLACLLRILWPEGITTNRLLNVLHLDRNRDGFERDYESVRAELGEPDPTLLERLETKFLEQGLRARFEEVAEGFVRRRRSASLPRELRQGRNRLVGELRTTLAQVCLQLLEPDLIILDEFQRFPDLLEENTPAGVLAHQLFNYSDHNSDARVLLLSATPYKMYTLAEERDEDDHYRDFTRTNDFLFGDKAAAQACRDDLEAFRLALYGVRGRADLAHVASCRGQVEDRLRQVMARSERVAMCADPDAMMATAPAVPMSLQSADLASYLALQATADVVHQPDMVEYWKSAVYPLNFMGGYRLRQLVDDALDVPETSARLRAAFGAHPEALLPSKEHLAGLGEVGVPNPRVRWLLDLVEGSGLDRLPWIPPTLPYYELAGLFATKGAGAATKLLVFSSWRVVPRSVASLVSYVLRHRILGGEEALDSALRRKQQPLRFNLRQVEGEERLAGLGLVNWLYPSWALADLVGVLSPEAMPMNGGIPTYAAVAAGVRQQVLELIDTAAARYAQPEADSKVWQWAASVLVDAARDPSRVRAWLGREATLEAWKDPAAPGDSAARAALARILAVVEGREAVGLLDEKTRAATADILTSAALGSPAVCALRTLADLDEPGGPSDLLLDEAASMATAMRGLFNQPEVIAMVRNSRCEPRSAYWRRALAFAGAGCLQSVLDEYAHVLRDSLGWDGSRGEEVVAAVAGAMREAVSLPSAQLVAQHMPGSDDESGTMEESRFQCRVALPFGEYMEQTGEATRAKRLREAFNSPFWPFVLVSTSVGQEGLDFHWYCHAVAHWNLPSNPIDLEQREGRVHRYKGHAIRKNVMRQHGVAALRESANDGEAPDVWETAFALAEEDREPGDSELMPYWVYPSDPTAEDAKILRYMPHLPLSREAARLPRLRASLALYRMAFGQPRQEDLVRFLAEGADEQWIEELSRTAFIDLRPPCAGGT